MSDEIRISGHRRGVHRRWAGLALRAVYAGLPAPLQGLPQPDDAPFRRRAHGFTRLGVCGRAEKPHRARVTFSGGEPFVQSGKLAPLAERLRAAGYNLTSYTGYLYEELLADSRHMPLLRQLDILVDGPFILEEKSLIIRFRGSRNQRIIDVPRSLAEGRVVLHPAMD